MNIPFLGIFFPIEEAIVITCIIIIVYLIVFRFEFKQLSIISKKIGDEETELNKDIKELQQELSAFGGNIKSIDAVSSAVSSATKSEDSDEYDMPTDDIKSDDTKSEDIKVDAVKADNIKSSDPKVNKIKADNQKTENSEIDRLKKMLD